MSEQLTYDDRRLDNQREQIIVAEESGMREKLKSKLLEDNTGASSGSGCLALDGKDGHSPTHLPLWEE